MKKGLLYTHTNENLKAIIEGLNLKNLESGSCLAVGGSGDQSFAILEYVNDIAVVDINSFQIDLIKERVNLINNGDFSSFLNPQIKNKNLSRLYPIINYRNLINRNKYFSEENKLSNIRHKLNKMKIYHEDILNFNGKFDFIYLSNIMSWKIKYDTKFSLNLAFLKLSENLNKNGLLYISDLDIVSNNKRMNGKYSKYLWKIIPLKTRLNKIKEQEFLPNNIIYEEELSTKAQKFDSNMQVSGIYRKIVL